MDTEPSNEVVDENVTTEKELTEDPILPAETNKIPADTTEPPTPADTTELPLADTIEPPTPADSAEPPPADTKEHIPNDVTASKSVDITEPQNTDTTETKPADSTEHIPIDTTEPTPADTTELTPADTKQPMSDDVTISEPADTAEPPKTDTTESKPADTTEAVQPDIAQQDVTTEVTQEEKPVIEVPIEQTSPLPKVEIMEDNSALSAPSPRLKSPSPTRSSLSRKESRSKHHKRVSFTGTKLELENNVTESTAPIWPLSADFTAEAGEKAVGRYVSEKWTLSESWLHCIEYIGEQPAHSKRHSYRVKFSQPTRRRPIPAHYACVYFTLVTGESEEEVKVWWVMEGQRLPHKPEEGLFREQWLRDILTAKSLICSETLF